MLTYATFFVVCVVLAVVARFVYKAVSESSMSLSTSKVRVAIVSGSAGKKNGATSKVDGRTSSGRTNASGRQNPTRPSKKDIDWGWQKNGTQVRTPHPRPGAAVATGSHCSLYDVNTAQSTVSHGQKVGRPYRENKLGATGRSYKVSRKVTPKTQHRETVKKPWGW